MYRFYCFIIFISFTVSSQSIKNKALPQITHYDTKGMGFNAQSWDIKQGDDGVIYIANGKQILIFDGTNWKSVITDPEIVNRSLFVKNKDSIFFGADEYHGILIKKGYTDFDVFPLRNSNKDVTSDVEEYWRTHFVNNEIVFQTFRNLYVNQENIITKIPAPYRFKWSYKIDEEIYVNDLKYGVFKLKDTNLIPIISDVDINENIIGVTKIQEDLLVITDTKGLFTLVDGVLKPVRFSISDELKKVQIFSFLKLKDNRIAMGTVSNGLYILDLNTGKVENLNKRNGLQNNTILAIFQDNEDNLWLALDYGVDYVKLNSPLTYFYDYYGELGTTYAVVKDKNLSYLGTNQGLYVSDTDSQISGDDFEILINGQVWNIEEVDGEIFVGHDKGAFAVNGKELTKMGEDLGVWNFRAFNIPDTHEKVLISGNYNGVSVYQKKNDQWKSYMLKGFEKSARYLEIDKNNNIWLALRSEGVFRFTLDFDKKELIRPVFYPITDFGGTILSLSKIDDTIVVTSDFHLYTYTENETFDKVKIGENKGEAPRILKKGDEIWYLGNEKVVVEDKEGITVLHGLEDQLVPDVLNVFSLNDENKIIPVFNGFSMYTKKNKTILTDVKNSLLIRNVASVSSGKSYTANSEIPYNENSLRIDYALPIYGEEIVYQTKINDNTWSNWTEATAKSLYNLKEGNYSFSIRAKYNGDFKGTTFDFVIKPPIYRTSWAYLLYFLLFLLLILSVISVNRYKMKRQARVLLKQKAEKLQKQEEEHRAQKLEQEHKIIELNNSKLQDEIKAKSRELTQIAYVNLNKNKILKKIRDKIVKIQESSPQKLPTNSYNELVRLVEYYITDKESKLFEINFDKSHQEFYEKLSKNYPNLTSKDLRLCAYLKMNLSSKEIAPLLGISSQSVDVSRHRLRKKLNLGAKDNLTNILISLK